MLPKISADLTNKNTFARISPEMLELMGKSAANTFMQDGVSLNESISKLAAAHNDISQEQIKRICEFANTAVYLAKHDMAKTAGAKESYPEFDLADPNRVIQDLSDGTKSMITTKVDADYSKLPAKMKTASVSLSSVRVERAFEELFTAKTAEEDLDYSKDTAINEVMAAKDQLRGLRDHLSATNEQYDLLHKEASAEFYELSKRHVLGEGFFRDIVKAAAATGATGEEVSNILHPVVVGFLREKVASAAELSEGVRVLEKRASSESHRVINPAHPLVRAADTILMTSREMEKAAYGLRDVDAGLLQVNSFIRSQLRDNNAQSVF